MKHFTEKIINALRDKLPDVEITVQEVSKPGENRLTGLCFHSSNTNVAPVIYLEEAYDAFRHGTPIDTIAEQLQQTYLQNCLVNNFDTTLLTDWNKVSDRVCAKLINIPNNKDYLENKVVLPIPTTDIGYMYYIDLEGFTPQGASAPVSKILLDTWNVSLETLHATALANTENIMQPCVRPMNSMIQEMLDTNDEVIFAESMTMYVITSKQMMNGAILATFPSVCSKLQQHFGEYYLLPSSVHEMLAVPANLQSPDALLAMVAEINHTQVEPKDRLSDDVYAIRDGRLTSIFNPEEKKTIIKEALAWLPFPEVE